MYTDPKRITGKEPGETDPEKNPLWAFQETFNHDTAWVDEHRKLYSEGKRNDALLETILANVRTPEEWVGDVEAKIAGCWRGEQEIRALLDKYGRETFTSCCDYLIDYAERETRTAIRSMPDGQYVREDIFEDDGFGSAGVVFKLKVALQVAGDTLTADFTGTDPQAKGAINLPFSMTKAMYMVRSR